jgi:cytochrome c551/c552
VVGIVVGFMGSLLFNNDEQVATTEPPPQTETATTETTETTVPEKATESAGQTAETGQPNLADHTDNILVQKGCIACHAVSPIGAKGNGTAPDLAIAYEDVKNRFGKSLEEFLAEPEGTMQPVLENTPLTDDEKQKIISTIKEFSEQ